MNPQNKTPAGAALGTRYGHLVVESVVSYGRKATINFNCDCGRQHVAKLSVVKQSKNKGHKPECKFCQAETKSRNGLTKFDFSIYKGKQFGRLLVTGVDVDPGRKHAKTRLVCLCDCGAQAVVSPMHLTTQKTTSCGCFHTERLVEVGAEQIDHGHTTIGELNGHTSTYRAWMKIKGCVKTGIEAGFHIVCHEYDPRWEDYKEFLSDFGDIGMNETVSRKDNQLPWCKENCFINVGRRVKQAPLSIEQCEALKRQTGQFSAN